MAKKKAKPDNRQRFERRFDAILARLTKAEDKHTRCIVEALEVIAEELSELNVAASELMNVPGSLDDVVHHLELIDAQTHETAELLKQNA